MFDIERFKNAQFAPSQKSVNVDAPALADFFGAEDERVFLVRGITSLELARAELAASNQRQINDALDSASSGGGPDVVGMVDAIKKRLGVGIDVPPEHPKSVEILKAGCVDPKLDHGAIVKLQEVAPIEFRILVAAVLELTGKGQSAVGKPTPSGDTAT